MTLFVLQVYKMIQVLLQDMLQWDSIISDPNNNISGLFIIICLQIQNLRNS